MADVPLHQVYISKGVALANDHVSDGEAAAVNRVRARCFACPIALAMAAATQ